MADPKESRDEWLGCLARFSWAPNRFKKDVPGENWELQSSGRDSTSNPMCKSERQSRHNFLLDKADILYIVLELDIVSGWDETDLLNSLQHFFVTFIVFKIRQLAKV